MKKPFITAVIPAYNEEKKLREVVISTQKYVDEVIVVDDCSTDSTREVALEAGATVLSHKITRGYINALKTGFTAAKGDIIVTIDGDGQHNPNEIPKLLAPILEDNADLVMGKRKVIPRASEGLINRIVQLEVDCKDTGSGFRALKKELLDKMTIYGICTCGTFVLSAQENHARIIEVPISIKKREHGKSLTTTHIKQFFIVLYNLIRIKLKKYVS